MISYGLIGYPLSHSFSKKYFEDKFRKEAIQDKVYQQFELPQIEDVAELMSNDELQGFNVTSPYKEDILSYVQSLDSSASKVGAVNVVKREQGDFWKGYNSDFYGFKSSLENWLPNTSFKALVLGTGGASKAILAVLKELGISCQIVSRSEREGIITYDQLKSSDLLVHHQLIINTTPLGTYPNTNNAPDLEYGSLTSAHYLYDLVYNPSETKFMKLGKSQGSQVKNGLEMLELQAEKSWEIWTGDL